ncbi:MAG: glycosyltransferase family 2 protein [Alphaproteobacteria bacterium]|nr:glycosyltransferase family 2 protein [Alphaproteobacteria bacterium]
MIENQKITVVMPAYNAEKTLVKTVQDLPKDFVDDIILVDDFSHDRTAEIARELGIFCVSHDRNKGYGANQKTLYRLALERGADIVIMLHPDYQYNPRLVPAVAWMLTAGCYDVVLASRMLVNSARRGGMPLYKYVANRFLTGFQNLLLNQHLSEYHTGFRGYRRCVLEQFDFSRNSDDFVFDNQFLSQAIYHGFRIGEISCPAKYGAEFSSINFRRSLVYGLGVMATSLSYLYARILSDRHTLFRSQAELPSSRSQSDIIRR